MARTRGGHRRSVGYYLGGGGGRLSSSRGPEPRIDDAGALGVAITELVDEVEPGGAVASLRATVAKQMAKAKEKAAAEDKKPASPKAK